MSEAELTAKDRNSPQFVLARMVGMYVARETTRASLTEIGNAFKRDHTCVLYASKRIRQRIAKEECVRDIVLRLIEGKK